MVTSRVSDFMSVGQNVFLGLFEHNLGMSLGGNLAVDGRSRQQLKPYSIGLTSSPYCSLTIHHGGRPPHPIAVAAGLGHAQMSTLLEC